MDADKRVRQPETVPSQASIDAPPDKSLQQRLQMILLRFILGIEFKGTVQ